ncbi:MAG: response regulator, partial [Clostridiales bacterium]
MIYIVEDDDNIRDLEIYALNNSGFPAQGFISGEELAEACQKELPALILLDIMLPDEDGLQILQKLRCHENTAYIPVIMVTAKTGEIDKVKGLDLGADDYI